MIAIGADKLNSELLDPDSVGTEPYDAEYDVPGRQRVRLHCLRIALALPVVNMSTPGMAVMTAATLEDYVVNGYSRTKAD